MSSRLQHRVVPAVDLPDGLHPVIKRVLAARGVTNATQLDYNLNRLHHYNQLSGIDSAVTLLSQALKRQSCILIVGDYDADGATSCALAVRALRQMGAKYVHYLVPNREKHGYGLTPTIVELALRYQPELLMTVDNGIASFSGVAVAKQQGIRVLVTDHHLPASRLPAADAIVNPNQPDDRFPSKYLAGVGVVFYVMLALRAHLRETGWFETQSIPVPNLANLLDLVALGTVADVASLDDNNRILVQQGLRRIRAQQCCPGIQALVAVSSRPLVELLASDLGFFLGPRLNAAGRMEDMSYGIACLLSDNFDEALEQAQLLNLFNKRRSLVQDKIQSEAFTMVDELSADAANLPFGLCLLKEDWHQGVIGIVASRLKDRLHRPVIVFTNADNHSIKGSARSVAGVHIRDVLASIATQHPSILEKFGGHAMAAGLSLPRRYFEIFQTAFDHEVRKHLFVESLQGIIYTDGELHPRDFTLELAEQLRTIAPFGQGFPEPLFDGYFQVLARQVLKEKHVRLQLRPPNSQIALEAIAFNAIPSLPENITSAHLVYKLDVNIFQDRRALQLRIEQVIHTQ